MPTQTSRPGESLRGGVWGRVDVRWDSLLAWDEKCSDRASAGCALISVCVWIGWLELCWSHAFHSKLMNLWYWTSESSDLPQNRPVEGINFGCLFQPPPWFVLVCVYAGSHIWLCTRMLSKHWPPCVWVCAPASVYCWTAKAILTIKRRATSWASTYPAFPSLLMSACCVAYSQWQAAYCWKCGEAKCSLPTKRGHLKSTVSPLCFWFVLLGCRRIGGKCWCSWISVFLLTFFTSLFRMIVI